VEEKELNRLFYFTPAFIIVGNLIYTQVNIGDKLLDYFKTKEEEFEINIDKEKLLSLLYKKKAVKEKQEDTQKEATQQETPSREKIQKENTKKEENLDNSK
jgi:hypothetical protein